MHGKQRFIFSYCPNCFCHWFKFNTRSQKIECGKKKSDVRFALTMLISVYLTAYQSWYDFANDTAAKHKT